MTDGSTSPPEFVDVNVDIIRELSGMAPFDVYIRRGAGKYTKLFPRGEAIDLRRLDHYRQEKEILALSVQLVDFQRYMDFVQSMAVSLFDNEISCSPEELVPVLGEMINLITSEIISKTDVSADEIRSASTTVRGCIRLLSQNPGKMVEIFKMLIRHPYALKHSISTSLFSLLLAEAAAYKSPKSKEMIGLGAMLHDIGMSRLPFNSEEETDLTPEQWRLVKEHPQLGKRIMDTVPEVSREVSTIILEHHEQPNGLGYPNGLHGPDIFAPSKVVSIADSFTALLSIRPFREKPLFAKEALEIMADDRGKFDSKLLEIFSRIFKKSKAAA